MMSVEWPKSKTEPFDKWLYRELFKAYLEARKGKRTTTDEQMFEINDVENIMNLRDAIMNRTYEPGRGIAFVTRSPVIREIFAAPFRDRVVHHFLFNVVGDWWDKRLIYDCYSCRKGKGTWFGVKRAAKHIRKVSENYTKKAYIIKLDIRGYFMSLPRQALFERVVWGLDRQFSEKDELYRTARYLWGKVIFDDPTINIVKRGTRQDWIDLPRSKSLFYQLPGNGIVIGNLSSQLLSNIYLDKLDRYITIDLGYKNYGRYVDDFYIIVDEGKYGQAKDDILKIESFLRKELKLKLHPQKRYCQDIERGMPFLGTVIYPRRIVAGKRVVQNFQQGVIEFENGMRDSETVVSYMGFMKNLNGKKKVGEVFGGAGWEYKK